MNPIKLARYALAGWVPGGQCQCTLCGHRVWRFMPYQSGSAGVPELMRELEIIGSDIDHFECPHCGAHDRERHLLLYLKASGVLAEIGGRAVLHFAPEKRLWRHITGGWSEQLCTLRSLSTNAGDTARGHAGHAVPE